MSNIVQSNNWSDFKEKIKYAVTSGLLPDTIKTPHQAFVIAVKGEELGIPMMQAFSSINIIKGKPTLAAELMLGLVYSKMKDAEVNFLELSNKKCIIEARRTAKNKMTIFEFSIEDAKKAGITGNATWSKYTSDMLRSRTISRMCRTLFPDVIMGCYTPEELGETREVTETTVETSVEEVVQEPSKELNIIEAAKVEEKQVVEKKDPSPAERVVHPHEEDIQKMKNAAAKLRDKITDNNRKNEDVDHKYGMFYCKVKGIMDVNLEDVEIKRIVDYLLWLREKGKSALQYKSYLEFSDAAHSYLQIRPNDDQRFNYFIEKYKANKGKPIFVDHNRGAELPNYAPGS